MSGNAQPESINTRADPTRRFSNRVENYLRFRPGYPDSIISLLTEKCGLTPASVIGDLGSGTGILTTLFLKNGNLVFAIEPNREMREAAERLLGEHSGFRSIDATAEATSLPAESIDIITAGQAFHWFAREQCRREFLRILRPRGWVVLIWNDRRTASTSFLKEYESFLHEHAVDYSKVDHKRMTPELLAEFYGHAPESACFSNVQEFDYAGLEGRLLSSSYVPAAGEAGHVKMLEGLKTLFEKHANSGRVLIEHDTRVFFGRIAEG